jgi:AcrR family transcriptional regulator
MTGADLTAVATMRRRQGRPAAQEPSVGREGLLQRTLELLREMPPAELTRAELARRSGVDPTTIRHYFKDRDSLMIAAGAALLEELHSLERSALAAAAPEPRAQLRARIRVFLNFMHANPHFHRMMAEELMSSPSPLVRQAHHNWTSANISEMRELMSQGVGSGDFSDRDGAFIFIMIIGASEFFSNAAPLRRIAFGDDAEDGHRARDISRVCGLKGHA